MWLHFLESFLYVYFFKFLESGPFEFLTNPRNDDLIRDTLNYTEPTIETDNTFSFLDILFIHNKNKLKFKVHHKSVYKVVSLS